MQPSPVYTMLLFKDAKSNDFHWQHRWHLRFHWQNMFIKMTYSIDANIWQARIQVCSSSPYEMHSTAWPLTVCPHWWLAICEQTQTKVDKFIKLEVYWLNILTSSSFLWKSCWTLPIHKTECIILIHWSLLLGYKEIVNNLLCLHLSDLGATC